MHFLQALHTTLAVNSPDHQIDWKVSTNTHHRQKEKSTETDRK